jgi:hypothetical protein
MNELIGGRPTGRLLLSSLCLKRLAQSTFSVEEADLSTVMPPNLSEDLKDFVTVELDFSKAAVADAVADETSGRNAC